MTITLGDNPLTQVKILEVGGKPPNSPAPSPSLQQQVNYVEAPKQVLPNQKVVDITDSTILNTPQGKPVKPSVAQNFALTVGAGFLEQQKANAQAEQGRQIGAVVGGALVGFIETFTNKETDVKNANSYLVKGGYAVGQAAGQAMKPWLRDRKNDIKQWIKDLTKPKPQPESQDRPRPETPTPQPGPAPQPPPQEPEWPINWPDIFPDIPEIPFPKFEPNFDQFDPEFNFDEYKKVKPKPEKKKDKKDFPIQKPIPPKPPTVDNSNDQRLLPTLNPPSEQDIDFPPLQGTFNFKFSFHFIGETVVNRTEWYFNSLKAMGQATSKNQRVFFYGNGLIEYSGKVTDPRGLRCRITSQNSETTRYTWYIFARDVNAFGVPKPGIPVGNYFYFRLPNTEQIDQFFNFFHPYDTSLWQSDKADRTNVTPVNINIDVPKILPPENEPPSTKKERKVTTCLFDQEKIKRLLRSLKAKIEVPVVEAIKKNVNGIEIWVPKINRTQIEVIAIDESTAASVALIYRKIAEIQIDLIKMRNTEPPIAAIPEWWPLRIGAERPQLVVFFAEKRPNGKLGRTRWPITIPHYNSRNTRPNLPTYRKGQWQGMLTLKDNSKLIVNAISQQEAERVINAIKPLIAPNYLIGAELKVGIRKGKVLKNCVVKPTSARYFSSGQKNTVPDWAIDL